MTQGGAHTIAASVPRRLQLVRGTYDRTLREPEAEEGAAPAGGSATAQSAENENTQLQSLLDYERRPSFNELQRGKRKRARPRATDIKQQITVSPDRIREFA